MSDNELIAEFMGKTGLTRVHRDKIVPYVPDYDSLWDLLMPVVEKIREKYAASDHHKSINTAVDDLRTPLLFTTIKATHQAVVEFIKWYNSQNP